MKVREATPADAAAIARVHYDTWQTAFRGILPDQYMDRTSAGYEKRKSAWESALKEKNRTKIIGVAEDESGQIVGFAVAGPERTGDPAYQGELEAIYVLQSHQRRGVGRALISWAAARLAESGFTSMLLWTLADSPYRPFYERLGGNLVRETERDFGGVMLKVVAYGWSDPQSLTDKLA
jgi:GNAT superfamily N-acetyltransferase